MSTGELVLPVAVAATTTITSRHGCGPKRQLGMRPSRSLSDTILLACAITRTSGLLDPPERACRRRRCIAPTQVARVQSIDIATSSLGIKPTSKVKCTTRVRRNRAFAARSPVEIGVNHRDLESRATSRPLVRDLIVSICAFAGGDEYDDDVCRSSSEPSSWVRGSRDLESLVVNQQPCPNRSGGVFPAVAYKPLYNLWT